MRHARRGPSSPRRQPLQRVLVVEGPGRDDGKKDKGCAANSYPKEKLDVLEQVADEKSHGLYAHRRRPIVGQTAVFPMDDGWDGKKG